MEIIVYSASWCRDCREAKRFLSEHNLAYKEEDIERTPGAAEEVIRQVGNEPSRSLSLMENGFNPINPDEASFIRRWLSCWGFHNATCLKASSRTLLETEQGFASALHDRGSDQVVA